MDNNPDPFKVVLSSILLGICLVIIAGFLSFGIRYGWLLANVQFSF